MTCPVGHVLKDKFCTIAPTMTCSQGYKLENNMCVPTSGTGTDNMSMGRPPRPATRSLPPNMPGGGELGMSGTPAMSLGRPQRPATRSLPPNMPGAGPQLQDTKSLQPQLNNTNTTVMPSNIAPGNTLPIAPVTTSACPEGFSLNSSDNMCYPL